MVPLGGRVTVPLGAGAPEPRCAGAAERRGAGPSEPRTSYTWVEGPKISPRALFIGQQ